MDRTRKVFVVIVSFVAVLVVGGLTVNGFKITSNQTVLATHESLEAVYQSCLASKNIGNLQAAYDKCSQLVALAPNYSDAQAQLIEVREALLADYYEAGVAAFNRELWLEAIGWFDKVLAFDLSYRDTADLKAQAMVNGQITSVPPISNPPSTSIPEPVATRVGGLVAYWSFDNAPGNDDSGNGHHGTVFGNPEVISGVKGNALRFDGDDDYIAINNDPAFEPGNGNHAIAAWVRYQEGSNHKKIILIDSRPSSFRWVQMGGNAKDYGEIIFGLKSGTNPAQTVVRYSSLRDGEWHFVVGVRDDIQQIKLYVDGVLVQEVSNPELGYVQTYSQDPIFIGYDNNKYPNIGCATAL